MKKEDFKIYRCFSISQRNYLIDKGFRYETIALDPNTQKKFWLFLRNENLSKALSEYEPYRQ